MKTILGIDDTSTPPQGILSKNHNTKLTIIHGFKFNHTIDTKYLYCNVIDYLIVFIDKALNNKKQ